jgi:hypothetical protein
MSAPADLDWVMADPPPPGIDTLRPGDRRIMRGPDGRPRVVEVVHVAHGPYCSKVEAWAHLRRVHRGGTDSWRRSPMSFLTDPRVVDAPEEGWLLAWIHRDATVAPAQRRPSDVPERALSR